MIDSVSDIVLRATDATPKDIVLRVPPSPRNPMNRYPTAAEVKTGVVLGAGLPWFQNYETGTYAGAGGSAVFRPVGSAVVRRLTK